MNISQTGINLIKQFEGCILNAYKDAVGVPTIGYGHTGGVYMNQRITQAEADTLLRHDLDKFEDGVTRLVKVPINQNHFDALVSFSFNVGLGALGSSTLLKLLNAKNYVAAAKEFARWNKAGGEVLSGLTRRRAAEAALFSKPVPQTLKYPGHPIKRGSSNTLAVKEIQKRIVVTADGVFGPKTEAAVKTYQKKHGLVADGIVGPKTWDILF